MTRRVTILSTLALALFGTLGAQWVAGQDTISENMLKLIPDPLPAGAVAQDKASFYSPDNLYKYMDGGADIFVLYGVRTMLHMDVRAQAVDVSVDIFDMGSPDTAFGMYAAERSPDYNFVSIGTEGYWNSGILNFLLDRYYVKLSGFGNGADAVLATLARGISLKIGSNPAFPPLLARLPVEDRKPHSEQYIPNDPLGHSFLGPAYAVAYSAGGQESKLYVTLARDEADARQRLQQLTAHFTKTGQCKAAPEIAEGAIRAGNSFEGTVIAQASGRYLLLLLSPAAGGDQLLKNAAMHLP